MPHVERAGPLPPVLLLSFLLLLLVGGAEGSSVYVKLQPGRELCVSYEGRRDPGEEPPTVDIRHRALDPRNVNIRTRLYGPDGKQLLQGDRIDPFGRPASIFFKVVETGTYRLCMRTPLSHPPLRFEIRFLGEKDVVDPVTTVDGTAVVDKPVSIEDYKQRLRMLDICVQVTLDELRMSENRLHMLDGVTQSTYYRVVAMLFLNVALAIGLNLWAGKYLERYFIKRKTL